MKSSCAFVFASFIVIICSLIPEGCTSSQKLNKHLATTFDTEAHRGGRGLFPENTIPAMLNALDLSVTTLEMDVQISKDGNVVVSHDAWFNPDITTKPDGFYLSENESKLLLYNMTYDSIKMFDVGMKPYSKFPQQQKIAVSKPLLSLLIDSVEAVCARINKTIYYNIEIKSSPQGDGIYHPDVAPYTDLVMNVINEKGIKNRVMIQSFDMRPLQYLHDRDPRVKTSFLVEGSNKRSMTSLIKQLRFVPDVYSPQYSLVTQALLDSCHAINMKVVPWTVNDLSQMKKLKAMGVDGIISDYPNLFADL